jgi:hypothetical protein
MSLTKVTYSMIVGAPANIQDYGATGSGANDTSAVQNAINNNSVILIPVGTWDINPVTVPSNKTIIVEGTLRFRAGQADDAVMISNSDVVGGNTNIIINGSGKLDGNKANQTNDRQGIVKLTNCTNSEVSVKTIGGNKYAASNPTLGGVGCVVLIDCEDCRVQNVDLMEWQREGIYVDGAAKRCTVTDIVARGDGVDSWSAVAVSGATASHNTINNVIAYNCGASSVVLDSQYSACTNIVSYDNQFQNGVNFGHTGKPASHSVASNITVYNAGAGASSGTTHSGIAVVGGTTDFTLTNFMVDTAYNHGVNVSDSAQEVTISNGRISNANGSGVNVFNAPNTNITGVYATSNAVYGINLNATDFCLVTGCDLRGNTTGGFSASGSNVALRSTRLSSTDSMVGSVNLAGLASGGTVAVNNENIYGFYNAISIYARSTDAANGNPYIVTKATETMTVAVGTAVTAGGGPHNLSYEIL